MASESGTYRFAILVFGQLGDSARISLLSILHSSTAVVCVAGDSLGIAWIKREVATKKSDRICIHSIPIHELINLGLSDNISLTYSNFGDARFIKLTTFKWFLLRDLLTKHNSLDFVVFSDLDVFWFPEAFKELSVEVSENLVSIVQDDTPQGAKEKHFCTGIMIWFNKNESVDSLTQLYDAQYSQIVKGNLIPDEPTFNKWYMQLDARKIVMSLNSQHYVIGHRFFDLVISRRIKFHEANAFHANYVIGEQAKKRRLRVVSYREKKNLLWIPLYFRELFAKLIEKVRLKTLYSSFRKSFRNHFSSETR
jgi:hypothetical protein